MALTYEIPANTADGLSLLSQDGDKGLLFTLVSLVKDLQQLYVAVEALDTAGSHSISIPVQITSFEPGADLEFIELHTS